MTMRLPDNVHWRELMFHTCFDPRQQSHVLRVVVCGGRGGVRHARSPHNLILSLQDAEAHDDRACPTRARVPARSAVEEKHVAGADRIDLLVPPLPFRVEATFHHRRRDLQRCRWAQVRGLLLHRVTTLP